MSEFSLITGLIEFKPTGVTELDETIKYVAAGLKDLGKSFGSLNMGGIGAAFGEAKEHLSHMLEMGKSLGLDVIGGLESAFTSAAPQLAQILAVPIVGEIAAGVAAVIALAAAGAGLEREHSRFDTLTGGDKQTTELFEGLNKDFKGTDIDVGGLKSTSKEMMAAGMSVEEVGERLKSLGNVSLFTGKSVQGMQSAMERMEMTGKVGTHTLRAFGLGFEQEMAKARGISLATLREQASSGMLHASDFKAEVDRQGGAGGKGDQIRNAELNDVFGQLAKMGHNLIEPFEKLGLFVIKTLNLGGALGVVNSIINVFGSAIEGIIVALTPVGELIGSALAPIWSILSGALTLIAQMFIEVGTTIGWLLDQLAEFTTAMKAAVDSLNKIGPGNIKDFSKEDIAGRHEDEKQQSYFNKLITNVHDDTPLQHYRNALQKELHMTGISQGFDHRTLDQLEEAVAKRHTQGNDNKENDMQGGGSMTSFSGLWDKIQEAAMKQNETDKNTAATDKNTEAVEEQTKAIQRLVDSPGGAYSTPMKPTAQWIRK